MSCDREWELDALREGRLGERDAESLRRHLRVCWPCRVQHDRDERLWNLARRLPGDGPDELALRRLRARVLKDVAVGVAPRNGMRPARVAAATVGVVALAVCAWSWHSSASKPSWAGADTGSPALPGPSAAAPAQAAPLAGTADGLAGTVHPGQDARWRQTRDRGLERVVLDDGTLDVQVRHQLAGERFLVQLPDGELEVRGTTFDVSVAAGVTRAVHVREGLVELRLAGQEVLRLAAGESWARPARSARAASVPAVAPASPRDDGTGAYGAAVQMLRDGRPADAASAFEAFLLAYPRAAQAEDASFLEALSLARAGRVDAAGLAAEHHLSRYPASFHRKDAATLVARAAVQRGDCARARSVLASWPSTPDIQATLASCAEP